MLNIAAHGLSNKSEKKELFSTGHNKSVHSAYYIGQKCCEAPN